MTDPVVYLVELLLQFLVGIVDAELLEAVDLKGLKSTDRWRRRRMIHSESNTENSVSLKCYDPY